jgi:predicted secreted acid phosphatase
MQPPMLVRPSLALLACVLASLLACKPSEAEQADPGLAAAERAKLEQQIAALETQNEALTRELETERGCRKQVLGSLSAFAEGPYDEVVANTVEDAKALLEDRIAKRKPDEKLAIVLDVDETVLSNIEQLRGSGFCFVREDWNHWVDVGTPIELAGVRPLYDFAREHQIAVVFLSGRKEAQREDTERVLKAAGFGEWDRVLLRDPAEDELTAAEFKSGRRAKLETEGDQQSDLDGGHAEHLVLIPNPFYYVK